MQHVIGVDLQPASDERRSDRGLDRLIVLDVQLGGHAGRLAQDDADPERALVGAAAEVVVFSVRGGDPTEDDREPDRESENEAHATT